MTFVNEEDEESYQRIRERERRQLFLYDYPDEYLSSTEFGSLIVQQRSEMVHWIVEVGAPSSTCTPPQLIAIKSIIRYFYKTQLGSTSIPSLSAGRFFESTIMSSHYVTRFYLYKRSLTLFCELVVSFSCKARRGQKNCVLVI